MLPCGDLRGPSPRHVSENGGLHTMVVLPPQPSSVREARAFVRRQCREAGFDEESVETAALLTSELVTNAFLHGRSAARLVVIPTPDGIVVEVGDDNSRFPQIVPEDARALDGRGLAVVSRLARAWGVHEDGPGKVVWFKLSALRRQQIGVI